MVFSSPTFLFLFLPFTLILYYLFPKNYRNLFLVFASLFFYAWGETIYVLIMIGSIIFNYIFGLMINYFNDSEGKNKYRKYIVTIGISGNILLLLYFKYTNFLFSNLNDILTTFDIETIQLSDVHLPIGISFFTFQAISYLVDGYRQKCRPQRNFINCALYISLFPQLIAGPIVRYYDVAKQIVCREITILQFSLGIQRFIFGLSKKIIIANPLGKIADIVFALPGNELSIGTAWLGIVCYTLQIYYDFSGYSDMAIGLGRMFGFEFLENFNYPYIARSIRDFWRRWHISLSSWFRDYVYISLGGNRASTRRTLFNLWTVFLLCGLWHGANWNFLIWGALHGTFLIIERKGLDRILCNVWTPIQHIYTIIIVSIAWVFFRSESLPSALKYLKAMFGMGNVRGTWNDTILYCDPGTIIILIAGIIFSTPVLQDIVKYPSKFDEVTMSSEPLKILSVGYYIVIISLFFLSISSLATGTYNPFIYFRF